MEQQQPVTIGHANDKALPTPSGESLAILPKLDAGKALTAIFHHAGTDLRRLAQAYLTLQIQGVKAPETCRQTTHDLADFLSFYEGYFPGCDAQRWTPQATRRYLDRLQDQGRKPATIARRLISLRAFGKWLATHCPELLLLGDPTSQMKPPVQEALRPKCLTDRQVKAVLDAAQRRIAIKRSALPGRKKDRRPQRDYAILMLLLNGGLRRSEICDLMIEQFQGKKLVNVKCKGNFFRDLFLGQETAKAIQDYLESERGLDLPAYPEANVIFLPAAGKARRGEAKRLSPRSINAVVKGYLSEANAQLPKQEQLKPEDLHPHAFRHTHAYKLIAKSNIAQVQKRLGHRRPDLVVRYAQMPEAEEMKLIDDIEES